MNYYEELGLNPSATVQEIRHAYKLLAQLVHPDKQAHGPVRHVAERQMLRLNQMLATLTNEQTRREYDASLTAAASLSLYDSDSPSAASPMPHPPNRGMAGPVQWWRSPQPLHLPPDSWMTRLPEWLQPIVENRFWISLALAVVCVAAWYGAQMRSDQPGSGLMPVPDGKRFTPEGPSPKRQDARQQEVGNQKLTMTLQSAAPPVNNSLAAEQQSAPIPAERELAHPVQAPSNEPPASYPTPPREAVPPGALHASPLDSSATPIPAPSYVQSALDKAQMFTTSPTVSVAPTQSASLAGNWLYVPDPADAIQPGVYPASYVELLLAEEHGRIKGTYRAQYQVLDRAVSQEVSFQVLGDTPKGTSAQFKWTSADGAKGDLEIAVTGPNAMKVTWWTTRLGRHAALASGMAKLIRQQVR